MTRRELIAGGAGFGLAALALTAGSARSAGAQRAPREHRIEMARMRFGAVPAGIRAGDTILWVNADVVPHTVTARDGSFDLDLPARRSGRMRATRSGRFDFYCRYHPGMRGTLAVAR